MSAWMIVATWWVQGAFDRIRVNHLTTDPACVHHRTPRLGSWLDRASRGLECEPCMVHRAFGTNTKENTMCTFCGAQSDSLTIGSDGTAKACPDCILSADNA